MTTQNKEQRNTIGELSPAVKEFLRVQSTVKKLQGNIEKLSKQLESQEKFKVSTFDQSPNSLTLYSKEFCGCSESPNTCEKSDECTEDTRAWMF